MIEHDENHLNLVVRPFARNQIVRGAADK